MGFSYSAADWLQALHDLHIAYLLPICLPRGQPEDWLQRTFLNSSAGVLVSSGLYSMCGPVLWILLQACFRLSPQRRESTHERQPRDIDKWQYGQMDYLVSFRMLWKIPGIHTCLEFTVQDCILPDQHLGDNQKTSSDLSKSIRYLSSGNYISNYHSSQKRWHV